MRALKRAARRLLGPRNYDEIDVVWRLLARETGVMVDVGAHHGSAHEAFLASGWKVIALEPDPNNRQHLSDHPSLIVDARAVSQTDGERLSLFTSEVSSGISSLAAFHETHVATVEVETVRLDTLLQSLAVDHVNFLKVDTEGFDLPVLRTFGWGGDRPDVVVCEFEDRKTVPLGYTFRDLGDFLLGQGYAVLMSEWHPIVEYGRTHTWRRVVEYPSLLMDDAGWGNFIAVKPGLAPAARRGAAAARRRLRVRRIADRVRPKG